MGGEGSHRWANKVGTLGEINNILGTAVLLTMGSGRLNDVNEATGLCKHRSYTVTGCG